MSVSEELLRNRPTGRPMPEANTAAAVLGATPAPEGLAASSYCLLPFSSLRPLYLAKSLVNQTIGAGYVCTNLHTSLGTLRKAIKNFICMKACKPSGRRCERILKLKLESRDSEGNSKNPLWQEGQGDQNQQLPKRVGIPTGIFVRTGARRQRP